MQKKQQPLKEADLNIFTRELVVAQVNVPCRFLNDILGSNKMCAGKIPS